MWQSALPPESMLLSGSRAGAQYGWPVSLVPGLLEQANIQGLACDGGTFQFRAPTATMEMYWLQTTVSPPAEDEGSAYVQRANRETLQQFRQILEITDFLEEARCWPFLREAMARDAELNPLDLLVFVPGFSLRVTPLLQVQDIQVAANRTAFICARAPYPGYRLMAGAYTLLDRAHQQLMVLIVSEIDASTPQALQLSLATHDPMANSRTAAAGASR